MPMELILSHASVEITQGIKNNEQLKAELREQLEYYKGIVVTEDSMKDAKSDRATLNKLRTAIDDQRKAVKKQVEGLYKPFENDCRELMAMIDKPIAMIDSQVAALDEVRKKEKFAALTEFFGKINTLDFVRLEDVLDPKWDNKTAKLDRLKDEMSGSVQRIVDDYAEIRTLYADSPMLTAILQRFEQTRDKSAALAYAAEIERKERAEQERKACEEQARKAKIIAEIEKPILLSEKEVPAEEPITAAKTPERLMTGAFRVTGTKAQIIALREFMKANNITFEVIR